MTLHGEVGEGRFIVSGLHVIVLVGCTVMLAWSVIGRYPVFLPLFLSRFLTFVITRFANVFVAVDVCAAVDACRLFRLESERDRASVEAGVLRRQIEALQKERDRAAQVWIR